MTIARRRFTGARRSAGVSEQQQQAYWVARPGDKVMTREGFAGRVDDVLDGPQGGNEIYIVTLDNGMGGGEYGPGEIKPMSQSTSSVERTAADDYPELAEILTERPPLADHEVLGTRTAATYYLPTEQSLAYEEQASMLLRQANDTMQPVEVPDEWIETGQAHDLLVAAWGGELRDCNWARAEDIRVVAKEDGKTYLMPPDFETEVTVDENGDRHIVEAGQVTIVCPYCNGEGHAEHTCPVCRGEGRITGEELAQHTGGVSDWMVRQFVREPKPGEPGHTEPSRGFSYDWCRYRRNSHCFYPKTLNEEASKQAGYAVWVPFDRGMCGRTDWPSQQHCFSGDTEFLTYDGMRAFKEMVGEPVLVLTSTGQWVEAEVREFGVQPLRKIVLRRKDHQKIIYATPEHRWFIKGRKRSERTERPGYRIERLTDELRSGDRLAWQLPVSRLARWYPSPFGVAHGVVYGDGHRSSNSERLRGNDAQVTLWGEKDSQLLRYFSGSRKTTVVADGVTHNQSGVQVTGLPGFFKERPSLHESAEYLYGWLAGYFAADGSVDVNGTVTIESARREDLEFVQAVCNRLTIATYGIVGRERAGCNGSGMVHDLNLARNGVCALEQPRMLYRLTFVASSLRPEFFLIDQHRQRFEARRGAALNLCWKVESVEETDRVEPVYCAVVPKTESFVLASNILTGNCPVGQPGPHVPGGMIDATVPWEQGGQHGGLPGPIRDYASKTAAEEQEAALAPCAHYEESSEIPKTCKHCLWAWGAHPSSAGGPTGHGSDAMHPLGSRIDGEFGWHFTAAWRDVRAKAKKISADGHVRIIRAPGHEGAYLVAEVQGDNDVYQTAITRVPGKFAVAMWECGCAWSSYAWGRTGRWKRYEGRMCSHALALYYEAQRQEMFGGEMQQARFAPNWRDPSILPKTHYDKDKARSLAALDTDPDEPTFEETSPAVTYSASLLGDGVTPQAVMNHLVTLGVTTATDVLRQAVALSFPAVWKGRHVVVTVDRHGITVNGEPVSGAEIVNPNFDPRRGLSPHDAAKHANADPCTACGGTGEQGTGHECYICDGSGMGAEERTTADRDNSNPENGLLVGLDLANGQQPVTASESALCPVCSGQDESAQHTCPPMTASLQMMAPGPPLHPDHRVQVIESDGKFIPHCSCEWTHPDQPVVDDPALAQLLTVHHVQQEAQAAGYPLLTGDKGHPDQYRTKGAAPYCQQCGFYHHPDEQHYQMHAAKHEPGDEDQAQSFEGPTHGGLVLKAADTGRVLMLQRCLDDGTSEEDPAAGKWEFPGGGFEEGDETSLHGALREFAEEVGHPVPTGGHVSHVWRSPDGVYVGHVLVVPTEKDLPLHEPRAEDNPDDPDGDNSEQVAWWHLDDAKKNPALRDEVKQTPWDDLKKAAAHQPLTDFVHVTAGAEPFWWPQTDYDAMQMGLQDDVTEAREDLGLPPLAAAVDSSWLNSKADIIATMLGMPRERLQPIVDDIVTRHGLASVQAMTQQEFAQGVMDEYHRLGDLHDEPEPALPSTDGGEDDDALAFAPESGEADPEPEPTISEPGEQVGPETQGVVDPTVVSEGGVDANDVAGIQSRAWLLSGGSGSASGADASNADIAAAARQHLAKTALKSDWTLAQQKELIDEGEHDNVTASNLDLLDITGTHYEALEAKLRVTDPTDDEVLFS